MLKQVTKTFDIIVIGSGGGAKISSPSALLGKKVALIEKGPLGGTCLNRGCIPSKMLIHPADVATCIEHEAPLMNLKVPKGLDVDFETLVQRVSKTVDEDSASINPAKSGVLRYKDHGKFIAPKIVQVGDEVITADLIFVAAGARPMIPKFDGLDKVPYLTSTEALRLTKQPKKLCIFGGGYIACELGHYFSALGTEVTMLVRSSLLRHVDEEVGKEFARVFTKKPRLHVKTGAAPQHVSYDNEQYTIKYKLNDKDEETLVCDQLLVAAGVVPNSDELDCAAGGLKLNKEGFIVVDDYLKTNVDGVYAFGDIVGHHLFRHAANMQGEYLMETVIRKDELLKEGGSVYPIDYTGMPWAVFSYPQVAGVGDTEEDLKKKNISYVKGVNKYSSSAMAMALRSDSGFVKLLIERKTRKILGCHIVGEQASVLLHEVTPLVRKNGTLDDILYSIHIHPALSELIRNAARLAKTALIDAGDTLPLKLKLK